ncbi:MAG: CheR family methyltransferase, partial [Pyrinomonadaceae bacterium]
MKKKTTPKTEKKTASKSKAEKSSSKKKSDNKFPVVGLGASAGGIRALQDFFATMPPNSGMAFVVILHLSPEHESNLDAIIQAKTAMPVIKVTETHEVEPNRVYVIPPNRQLEMVDGEIRCTEPSGERGARVAIDVFFRTLAQAYERNAVCVVLSGTGTDGTLGLKRVKESNGFAIVQDPDDAEYDGMPRSAIGTNLADWILPVRQMPENLINYRASSKRLHLTGDDDGKVAKEIQADESLREILTILRVRTGHDFSNYKKPTLVRRIARQLQIHNLEDIPAYLAFVRKHPEEIHSLMKNLLINVTNFFRDRDAFDALEREVIPALFDGKNAKDTIRVWSCGCASGEEAYSLAMLLSEYAYRQSDPPKIQVFATDVDEDAIAEAREHRYPESIEADVTIERLKRFFTKEGIYYKIRKELRETVLFAPHNVLRDPPFSRLDLITCRNLLIYLNRETQDRVMEIFHFALAPQGYLFLGSSETADGELGLFAPVDKKQRIYWRRPAHPAQVAAPQMPLAGKWQINLPETKRAGGRRDSAFSLGEMHYKLLESLAPPAILVSKDFDVLYLSGSAGRYLQIKGGEPSSNLLKLVNPDLLPDLRAALFAAQREHAAARFENVRAGIDGAETFVSVGVRPVDVDTETNDFLLVIFEENKPAATGAEVEREKNARVLVKDDAMEAVVRRFEEELMRTKGQLRGTIEQHEVSIEELKASNEELQAINEELRSTTEELETSKEELQSVNEELTTVNHELKDKIDETIRANSDLQNLIASTDIATMFLDRALRIKRFTPPIERLFNITPADAGRPLEHFTHRLDYPNLIEDVERVLRSLSTIEREVRDIDGRTFMARLLPYRTVDDRIEGVVLNFIDISDRKRAEVFKYFLAAIVESSGDAVITADFDGKITSWNKAAELLFGYKTREAVGKSLAMLALPKDFKQMFADADKIKYSEKAKVFDTVRIHKDGREMKLEIMLSPVRNNEDEVIGISTVARDMTVRKTSEDALRASEARFRMLVESATDYAIFTLDDKNLVTSWSKGAENIFGWKEKEILGKPGALLFTPQDREKGVPEMEMSVAARTGRAEDERWHIRKDETLFFASGLMMRMSDGGEDGFVKICRDQTERVKAEATQRDKDMLTQLVSTQEDERRRIAREVHDHVGQQLTVLRLKLEEVKNMCGDEKICDEIDVVKEITEQLDREVDFLAWELRPASLDDLGLRVSLENFVREWSHHTGIKSEFHAVGLKRTRLAFATETNLYRIGQEALNNVYKHAKPARVSVLLEKRGDNVSLIIEDDGAGFDPKAKRNRTKGIGLLGMTERAKICGGTLEIESAKGKGTTVFARVPA